MKRTYPERPKQPQFCTYNTLEAWALALCGVTALCLVQYTDCIRDGKPLTWDKLALSAVTGAVSGLFFWQVQMPLRWLLVASIVWMFLPGEWVYLTGHKFPKWLLIPSTRWIYLWSMSGILGGWLYARWLAWKYEDYDDGFTLFFCYWGACAGPVLGVLGLLRYWQYHCEFKVCEREYERQKSLDAAAGKAWPCPQIPSSWQRQGGE